MSFDQMMIHFASPTVCGIKPANLFPVRDEHFSCIEFAKWRKEFAKHGIIARSVKSSDGVNLVLVYNVCLQREIFADDFVCDYLRSKGYYECPDCGHRYVPGFAAFINAPHMGRTRKMKCPQCGRRNWQKKVLTKD